MQSRNRDQIEHSHPGEVAGSESNIDARKILRTDILEKQQD